MSSLAVTVHPTIWVAIIGAVQVLLLTFFQKFSSKSAKDNQEIKTAMDTGNGKTLGQYVTVVNDKIDLLHDSVKDLKERNIETRNEIMARLDGHEDNDNIRFQRIEDEIQKSIDLQNRKK